VQQKENMRKLIQTRSQTKEKHSSTLGKDNENSATNIEETDFFSKVPAGTEILLEILLGLTPKSMFHINRARVFFMLANL
jgi:hypothetical protein